MSETLRDLIRRFRLEHDDDWQGTRKEVREWAKARFHGQDKNIGQVISIMTVNRKSRENRPKYNGTVFDIFFQLGEGNDAMLRFYSPGDKPYYEFGKNSR